MGEKRQTTWMRTKGGEMRRVALLDVGEFGVVDDSTGTLLDCLGQALSCHERLCCWRGRAAGRSKSSRSDSWLRAYNAVTSESALAGVSHVRAIDRHHGASEGVRKGHGDL